MDPLGFLFSLERLGMKFGLENISRLCEALGHPQHTFESVIVAGTNGKGSVTAMTERALRAAGIRSARYTSPHLSRLEERFVIDGREVETEELVAAASRVQEISTQFVAGGSAGTLPTFFEFTTATAFELFRRAGVEIAVLEVGLGGRLDATNVVTPVAAAITSIDLDHQAQLGNTLESIAREKAGVIKPGIPVVAGPMSPAAARVVQDVARERGARLVDAGDAVHVRRHDDGRLDLAWSGRTLAGVRLALRGAHQVQNAAVAVCLLHALREAGIAVNDDAIRTGLTDVMWPGRTEHLVRDDGTEILLDAAHNPAGAGALADYLREIGWSSVVLVFGAMQDKDAAAMLGALAPLCERIVCTTAASARAMPAETLASLARDVASCPAESVPDPERALAEACAAGRRVVVAGSVFLIGPLRGILR